MDPEPGGKEQDEVKTILRPFLITFPPTIPTSFAQWAPKGTIQVLETQAVVFAQGSST